MGVPVCPKRTEEGKSMEMIIDSIQFVPTASISILNIPKGREGCRGEDGHQEKEQKIT